MTRTLLVDNFDSFTYNLYDLLTEVNGVAPTVVRNDVDYASVDQTAFDNIVISPGPGDPTRPADFGLCSRLLTDTTLPVLGVCLGHQGLAAAHGARVVRAEVPMHGRVSRIRHTGTRLFAGLDQPLSVVRYHSLVVADLPAELVVTAWTDDGITMAIEHSSLPRWGVQFHPESIESSGGRRLLANFRDMTTTRADRQVPPEIRARSRQTPTLVVDYREVAVAPEPRAVFDAVTAGTGRFWLDGTARTEASSRFTIIGDTRGPRAEYVTYDLDSGTVTVRRSDGTTDRITSTFFDYLDGALRESVVDRRAELPFDFHLGFVGYLGYELKAETGGAAAHSSPDPDAALVFADRAVVLDHDGGRAYALCLSAGADDAESRRWLDDTAAVLGHLPTAGDRTEDPAPITTHPSEAAMTLRHDHAAYVSRIRECLSEIAAGESYEICLTNAGETAGTIDAVATFDHLRAISPVPYASVLEFEGLSVVSTSPERFLRVDSRGVVESKPIKGTRPRGVDAQSDDALKRDLTESEKDRAENLMIVDLVRNDLSRVCVPGSVHVPTLFGVETYATVHQLVSTVRGTLAGASVVDCLRATFPGGSMTGAPKIRTMEIIDRLEGGPRGVYSGSIGYLSLDGTADLSIVIRTMVVQPTTVRFGIGGAITALSDPEDEFEETLVKAATMQRALSLSSASASPAPARWNAWRKPARAGEHRPVSRKKYAG
ncbi:aminodeoxychorismate synthase component I [Rhodococcus sp. BP-349]|uniref:aminodeoxychorismate synthase component I n=1 Tax=unclassified Rhodococcus (in: high G+C Gram-positive bacteria) TaxID=192944 RepID=UPI001C9ACF03|nr:MULTISPECIES: aminodeoxychorismate synthase component I [unclassified Rhodococcus (in: high G+C Gram-positive bacteria)]MBY6539827.1 aminodeoxychorismate synthase component I [Rhodococcus sp. BP-363]MBY6543845.1 aminodeoxychorismate synthase component I [Rhodococcus sp. BP-369]MBY6563075.1 aminodeoxychorismate synthase component I [Rhodococcus sp. BP-370]MBY6577367.1 aminodeoxychorismate synthase component I [Rhodococcus sp. BP-364]MBY6586668.1 aminodeoxychorismate synthase component I [Rho